jgi:hypothetical protein
MDALGALERIVGGHLLDQGKGCRWQRRPTHSWKRLPPPEQAESSSKPAQEGIRLDNDRRRAPGREAASP